MAKYKTPAIVIVYLVIGLITESIILYLFPATGLGGVICYPFCVILSIAFGFLLHKLAKRNVPKVLLVLLLLCFIPAQFYLELRIHPQDYAGSPISQINNCKEALKKFDQIKYDSYGNLSKMEKVIYQFKFKDQLPKSFSILTIDSSDTRRAYTISNYGNGKTSYDTTKVAFSFTDTSVIISEKISLNEIRVSNVPMRTLLSQKGGGYYDRGKSIFYSVNEDNLQFKTGIETVFYYYLKMIK